MSVMDRVCAVCLQAIADEEQWFRVREEYVHLSCSEEFETGFGESATREAGSGEAAGDWGLILCQEGVESGLEIFGYLVRSEESPLSLYTTTEE